MSRGKSIRIFLVDGMATGIKTAEVSNWTGKAIYAPRTKLTEVKKREEIEKPGVYILLGPDPDLPGEKIAYIGEGENVRRRIENHYKDVEKEFWTEFVAFVSKDENLTKAHIRYLESRMLQEAIKINKVKLNNNNLPDIPNLPEPDREDMEGFLEYANILLSALGIRIFELSDLKEEIRKKKRIQKFYLKGRGAKAVGFDIEDGFLIEKESTAVVNDNPSLQKWYSQLKNKLIDTKQLEKISDSFYKFNKDVVFSSPSAAAAVITGQPMSGPQSWKTKVGKTYKEFIEELLKKEELTETDQ